jgi:hypothetical protein
MPAFANHVRLTDCKTHDASLLVSRRHLDCPSHPSHTIYTVSIISRHTNSNSNPPTRSFTLTPTQLASPLIGGRGVFVAARSIRGDEELTVAYTDVTRPLSERQVRVCVCATTICECDSPCACSTYMHMFHLVRVQPMRVCASPGACATYACASARKLICRARVYAHPNHIFSARQHRINLAHTSRHSAFHCPCPPPPSCLCAHQDNLHFAYGFRCECPKCIVEKKPASTL